MAESIPKSIWRKLQEQAHDALGDEFWEEIAGMIPQRIPRIDLYELDREITIIADIAGLTSPSQLEVFISGRTLTLKGMVPYTYPIAEEDLLISERKCGSFVRKLTLSRDVEEQPVQAKYEQGLLTIRLAMKPEPSESQVDIIFKKDEGEES